MERLSISKELMIWNWCSCHLYCLTRVEFAKLLFEHISKLSVSHCFIMDCQSAILLHQIFTKKVNITFDRIAESDSNIFIFINSIMLNREHIQVDYCLCFQGYWAASIALLYDNLSF